MKPLRSLLLLLVLLCSPLIQADDNRQAYVIALQQQVPEALIPAISPLLAEGDGISGFNNALVVTTTPDRIDNIRTLIQQLDKSSHNLLITVHNSQHDTVHTSERSISGEVETGDVKISTGKKRPRKKAVSVATGDVTVSARDSRGKSVANRQQEIRALEGTPAFIATGETRLVPARDSYGNITSGLMEANSGFYVTARLVGGRVLLDISTRNNHFEGKPGSLPAMQTQQATTQVSGNLGEWISLGSITLNDVGEEQELNGQKHTTLHNLGHITVRVTQLD